MTIDEAFAKLRECLSGARYTEGLQAMEVLRYHIDREVDEAMVESAIEAWFDTGFKYAGEHKPRMKAALIAALEVPHGCC